MKNVGYPIVPADAHITCRDKKNSQITTKTICGDGIIREIADFIV
jgi:3-deoxy-D-manno-octulosonate 8-phosphate phosphatase KdsC-like HAD superfamily phosphatase